MIKLKTLSPEAVAPALEKAKRYRLLNEPEEAESICLDILAVVPDHQDALILLLLALTDKFTGSGLEPSLSQAIEIVDKLDSTYCKFYYTGIINERRAKYHFNQGSIGSEAVAYDWFVKAMNAYSKALSGCDPDNQDTLLRWNSCARFINSHPDLSTYDAQQPEMLLDPFDTPH
jgi:hypothetical protein